MLKTATGAMIIVNDVGIYDLRTARARSIVMTGPTVDDQPAAR